jgi:hypothetical protein
LLDAGWRPRMVAAWFSLVRDDAVFQSAIEQPLHATHYRATEQVVAFVLTRRIGSAALPVIRDYLAVEPDDAVMGAIAAWADGMAPGPRLDWHVEWAELIERTAAAS